MVSRFLSVLLLAGLWAVAVCAPHPGAVARSGHVVRNDPPILKTVVRKKKGFKLPKVKSGGGDEDEEEEAVDNNAVEEAVDGAADDVKKAAEEAIEKAKKEAEDNVKSCFPAHATVERADGTRLRMDRLSVGDVVRVAPGSGPAAFSPVFMFTHKDAATFASRVTLTTASGKAITSTDGHYIYADGGLVRAKEVKVGAVVTLASGKEDAVVRITFDKGPGVYNPQTVNGDIVVDDVLASTYTTAVEPSLAHALLAPLRFLSSFGWSFTGLESGGGFFADVAPRGKSDVL